VRGKGEEVAAAAAAAAGYALCCCCLSSISRVSREVKLIQTTTWSFSLFTGLLLLFQVVLKGLYGLFVRKQRIYFNPVLSP
jgi:hypothetical protein